MPSCPSLRSWSATLFGIIAITILIFLFLFHMMPANESPSGKASERLVPRRCLDLTCQTALDFEPLNETILDPDDIYRKVVVGRLKSGNTQQSDEELALPLIQVSLSVDVLLRGKRDVLERETRMLVTANMLHQLSGSVGIAQILGSCQNGRRATSAFYIDAMGSAAIRPLNITLFLTSQPSLDQRILLVQSLLDILLSLHHSSVGSISLLDMKPSNFLLTPDDQLFLFDFGLFETSYAGANCSLLSLDVQRDGQCQLINSEDLDELPVFHCPIGACRGLAFNVLSACRTLILPLLDSVQHKKSKEEVRWKSVMNQLHLACASADTVGVFNAISSASAVANHPYPASNNHRLTALLL